jgi:hypothetical protein
VQRAAPKPLLGGELWRIVADEGGQSRSAFPANEAIDPRAVIGIAPPNRRKRESARQQRTFQRDRTNADIPALDIQFFREFDEEASSLGVKGLKELTVVSVAPAIANAVYHGDRQAGTRPADHRGKAVVTRIPVTEGLTSPAQALDDESDRGLGAEP